MATKTVSYQLSGNKFYASSMPAVLAQCAFPLVYNAHWLCGLLATEVRVRILGSAACLYMQANRCIFRD